jgi:hypothetical protein
LFWDGQGYAVAWEEYHAALDANRFLTISHPASQPGESLLLSDPDSYARAAFVNQVDGGYSAVWEERGITEPVQRLVMAELDLSSSVFGELRELEPAPIATLAYNGNEYVAILGHEPLDSYDFAVLSQSGKWLTEELSLLSAELDPSLISFEWHGEGFDLLYAEDAGEERRLAWLQISCQRD